MKDSQPRRLVWPAIAVAVALGVVLLSNRGGGTTPDGTRVLRSAEEYQRALTRARELTEPIFIADERGQPPSEEDRKHLLEAQRLFASMNTFAPTRVGPYLAAGRIHLLLEQWQPAERVLEQAIANVPNDPDPNAKLGEIEARHLLGQALLALGQNEEALAEASKAIAGADNVPNYRLGRARIYVQLNRPKEALADLDAALKLDPTYPRALQLRALIDRAESSR